MLYSFTCHTRALCSLRSVSRILSARSSQSFQLNLPIELVEKSLPSRGRSPFSLAGRIPFFRFVSRKNGAVMRGSPLGHPKFNSELYDDLDARLFIEHTRWLRPFSHVLTRRKLANPSFLSATLSLSLYAQRENVLCESGENTEQSRFNVFRRDSVKVEDPSKISVWRKRRDRDSCDRLHKVSFQLRLVYPRETSAGERPRGKR